MLAAVYPGLPSGWERWSDELKQSYRDNIPYVIAEMEYYKEQCQNPAISILLRTGDKEEAERKINELRIQAKLESVKGL